MSVYLTEDGSYVNAETGEVLGDAEIQALADSIAAEIVVLDEALAEARAEAEKLTLRREVLTHELRPLLGDEGRADGRTAWVVTAPPARPAQRVSKSGCDQFREQLLTLGLGRMAHVYQPPTISQVRSARAELVAAGVPLEVIAPTPSAGPSQIKVVPK